MIAKQALRSAAQSTRAGVVLAVVNRPDGVVRAYGGTDKLSHGYLPYYRRHLGPLRLRRNRVWEIGVGGYERSRPGGSLRVWRDYFPRSQIIGIDLHDKEVRLGRRVLFRRADQASADELTAIVDELGSPNVVIDDGSHVGDHIRASFETLFPRMPVGSWYVIEDLSTSYSPRHGGGRPPPDSSAVGLLRTLVSDVQTLDSTFVRHPTWTGVTPEATYESVGELHVYPGIAFLRKS